jgi:two-component system, OmpR family, sensor histidine kinase TctE
MTPALAELREENAAAWFVAADAQGAHVTFGDVPTAYASLSRHLRGMAWADLRDNHPPFRRAAIIRQERGPSGPLTILGHGQIMRTGWVAALAANMAVLPIFVLLATATILLTPLIVRRALAGVSRIAAEAARIDVDQRGRQLPEAEAPAEILPLVRAMNAALRRLDEGYQKQRRFIASAAHELRTPIAILRAKIDADGDRPARTLIEHVARVANLAEQLLDLYRLDTEHPFERVALAPLVRGVVADLAPLIIAADKAIEVRMESGPVVAGDAGALARVLTNLVQNGVEHGGRRVIVRVIDHGFEVEDDGPGIPPDERFRVFEPFHRIRVRSTGTGLGLNLVQEVVARHGGRATIVDGPGGGAIVRIDLPPAGADGGDAPSGEAATPFRTSTSI